MSHTEYKIKSKDGLDIFTQSWAPADKCRAVVCLVHGVGEHSGRFDHVAGYLNGRGCAVYAFDHRGHGRSGGQRGHFPDYRTAMQDMEMHAGQAAVRFPGLPLILYGHSMGGNLVLNYTLRTNPDVAGVIATAPMLRLSFKPNPVKTFIARCLIRLWPALSLPSGLDTEDISRDPAVVQAYDADPLTHDRVTPCFLNLMDAGEWALAHASEFSRPLLLMHGGEDRITSPENTRLFARDAGAVCTLKIWDGLYHEIHNEPEKQKVFDATGQWLEEVLKVPVPR
ncbi:lysophospholipase [bacterium]|nr:lysophospholipase [bacterium]